MRGLLSLALVSGLLILASPAEDPGAQMATDEEAVSATDEHMCVLIDEWTMSDGEAFGEGFRRLGLGKLIGTRTWGGEIRLTHSNRLVDIRRPGCAARRSDRASAGAAPRGSAGCAGAAVVSGLVEPLGCDVQ